MIRDCRLASASGRRPVNRMRNQLMMAMIPDRSCRALRIAQCGIASSHCTIGRQLAIRSARSTSNVAGYACPKGSIPPPSRSRGEAGETLPPEPGPWGDPLRLLLDQLDQRAEGALGMDERHRGAAAAGAGRL